MHPTLGALVAATQQRWIKTGLALLFVPVFALVVVLVRGGNFGRMMPVFIVGLIFAALTLAKARSLEKRVARIIGVRGRLLEVVFEERRLPVLRKVLSFVHLIGHDGEKVGLVRTETREVVESALREVEPGVVFRPDSTLD